ncbi:MAG: Ig domain-containing protein [Tannerella sp.]|jgi:hypothetical protein|nr:Ig domain-containing protein [Tannerella sp.]
MKSILFILFGKRERISFVLATAVMLAASVLPSVAQNLGSIGQAIKAAAPYNTVYFGIYPQTFFETVLEAREHLPAPLDPAGPFVVVASDNQKLNGGALSFGKPPGGQASIMYAEPLKWQIVKDDAEGFLLFTDGNVDVHAYNSPATNPSWNGTWEKASIRDWLSSGFLNGHSSDSIPPVYRAALTSYPSGNPGQYNHLIGLTYPHSDLPSPPAGSTTTVWNAAGNAVRTDFFTAAEKDAIVPSLLTNPTFGANPDNVNTTDKIFLPAADMVEAVYPNGADRKSVNTRYVMAYANTTSAPEGDDWLTRTHSTAPFPGYVTQIARNTGTPSPGAAVTRKPVRPALHLNRNRVLMVSQSKPGGVSTSFTATSFAPSGTLKLTLTDNAMPSFTATAGTSAVDGYIPVTGTLSLQCSGGKSGANSYISCLLEDRTGIRYYTRAAACTGSATTVNLNFTGVAAGTYTMKVFNEIADPSGKPDYACTPVLFDIYMAGGPLTAPKIADGTLSHGFTGRKYIDTVELSVPGSPAPSFILSSGSLPPDLSLNPATGRISGIPASGHAGNYTFTVRAKNPAGYDEKQFTLMVSEIVPPVIVTTQAALEAVDSAKGYLTMPYVFRFKLKAGTGMPSVKFYKTAGNLPTGLTLEADGTLHGVPLTVETQNFTICAETEGTYDYQSFSISILTSSANPILPYFVTQDLGTSAQVKENSPFADTAIQVTGSQYIHILYDPSTFPTGIAFDPSTRKILGTPIQGTAGTYRLHLWAKNPATKPTSPSGPDSTGIMYTLTVVAADVPLILTPPMLPPAPQGQFYTTDIKTDKPAALRRNGGILPPGMTFDPVSGQLSGTPVNAGTYIFTIEASNAEGASNRSFTIAVQSPSPPPVIDAITLPDGTAGEAYVGATVTATNSPTSWGWSGAPPGLSLSRDGIISGIPEADGVFRLHFVAANAWGVSVSHPVNITIHRSPLSVPPVFAKFLSDGIAGTAYHEKVYVFTRPDIKWTMEGGALPAGLTFKDGIVGGTPAAEGKYNITVKASSTAGKFVPVTQNLTLWIMSFAHEYRSRKILLHPVPGMTVAPAPDIYYVKSGDDFTFVLTPDDPHAGAPAITTSRLLVPDSVGVTVTPDSSGLSYTVVVHEIREETDIRVIPSANTPVKSATRIWSAAGRLYIYAPAATEVKIYSIAGNPLKTIAAEAGLTTVAGLHPGLYIVESENKTVQKVLLK